MTPAEAHAALRRAQQKIAEAEAAERDARYRLDDALANVGWRRLMGAFTPDATPLYKSAVFPDACLTAEQVVEHLEHQRRAAA
jgi:hypothetical protein